jgi:MGT family glycosyltransferase
VKVLAYTSPARGHLYPVAPIMAALAARGHRALLCGLSGELEHLPALGIEGRAIDPQVERNQLVDWRERSTQRAMLSALKTFAERAERDGEDLLRLLAAHEPDVLVIDVNCWGAAAVAEASGLPWAMFCPYLMPTRSRDAPPFGLGLAPMGGPLGAARDAIVRGVGERLTDRAAMGPVNAMRVRYGLGALKHYADLLSPPPLVLGLTAEGFEYPRSDWPANVRLVGPTSWAPEQPTPAWLKELEDPLVLVTCSTEHQRDKRLIHVALEGLPAAGMAVIATTAAHDPEQFNAPAGSTAVRFLAHEEVLRRAACVVCHGGMGITQKALGAGVPVVVVPFARDQFETARRVEHARAGVRLMPRRLTPQRLAQAVRRAMGMRAGAERVSEAYAAAGGAAAAADAIEALAAGAQAATGNS